MAKQISQDTFDAVVKENIEDFEMSPQQAIDDAVKQFEAQVKLMNRFEYMISCLYRSLSHYFLCFE